MAKSKTLKAPTANGSGPRFPVLAGAEESQLTVLRAALRLYDDMIIQDRYDIAGQVVDSYLVDPLDIAMRLSGVSVSTGPLPRNVLFYQIRDGQKRIGILVEPKVWTVNVSGHRKPWRVPLPALILVGQGMSYHLWALAGDGWPTAETELYNVPCSNVSDYGVCRGSAAFPVAGADTIWQAWQVFIESGFNSHLDNGKSKKHPASVLTLWEELHKAQATEYPVEDLVLAGLTLKGVIDG